ncbi:MAG: type II secretion system F family protein, partial [Planctomycetes bacterium]|nr:type II secretion system F family protein [Planctomycetota bacterium]
MPTFTFEAVDAAGRAVKDTIDAGSVEEARNELRKKKLFPTSISQKQARGAKRSKAAAALPTQRKKS